MFFFLSKILDLFLSPLTWAMALLALAVPWRARDRARWRRRRAFGIAGLAITWLASTGLVANTLQWRLERAAPSTYRDDAIYDAVIVLGGVGDERVWATTGQPALNDNVERIVVAGRLLREGKARFAIVSGGVNDPAYARWNEAKQLALQLREWGVEDDRVVVEDRARNTRENALYSAEIVRARGWSRVLVVTSAFHVPRAIDCFRAAHLDVDFLPVDYRAHAPSLAGAELLPRAWFLMTTTAVIREIAGRVVYRVTGFGSG